MSAEPEYLFGFCYVPAVELLRLHIPGQETREVAACEACARILRMIAL